MPRTDLILSAEVVLTPASGKSMEGAVITAANVHEYAPPPAAMEEAKRYLAEAGFTLGASGGVGFSISAPKSVFERLFGVKLDVAPKGAVTVKGRKGERARELPLGKLPAPLGRKIRAITFGRAPEFGPTGAY